MKLFNPANYSNLIAQINLTSKDICSIIQYFDLSFIRVKSQDVECMALPNFVTSFYDFVLRSNTIPTQIDYFDNYLNINSRYFSDNVFDGDIMNAIKARALRAFPSIVRDIHFATYLKEHLPDCTVIYNAALDINEGIDLMIINGKNYALNLFTDTQSAINARGLKANRHNRFNNVIYIDIPISLSKSVKVGDFYLYGDKEKGVVVNEIIKNSCIFAKI